MITETPDAPSSTDVPPPPSPPPSPGAMIREARERARLSLEDLAAHTKLARSTLEALECDDYTALLEPVYVRGYYRKCAKVLEIDEARLIAAYSARVSPKAPEPPSKLRLASGTELGSSSRLPVSMAVLAAFVAVVVCALLWFARDGFEQTVPSAPVVTQDHAPTLPPTPVPEVPATGGTSGSADAPAPVVEAAGAQQDTPQPAAAGAPAPTVAPASGTVRLRFIQDSWVRIDDATGKTLVNDMRRAGTIQAFDGALPLTVFLGNAPGVQVEYEGRIIDLTPHVRSNNTARLVVPQ